MNKQLVKKENTMAQVEVPLWDEGCHVILSIVTVHGTNANIDKIEQTLEDTRYIATSGGEPGKQSASEFMRRHNIK